MKEKLTFTDEQTLREFVTSRFSLQEMLKRIRQAKMKGYSNLQTITGSYIKKLVRYIHIHKPILFYLWFLIPLPISSRFKDKWTKMIINLS